MNEWEHIGTLPQSEAVIDGHIDFDSLFARFGVDLEEGWSYSVELESTPVKIARLWRKPSETKR